MNQASLALEKPRMVAEASRAVALRQTLEWTLRAGCALCFIGHGAFGILQKPSWVKYFAVVGIGAEGAQTWMPLVGAWDILMGVLVLTYPRPAIAVWMTAWAMWTATLRPLAGEPVWEAFERAGNFGVPFALLLCMTTTGGWRSWFAPARFVDALGGARRAWVERALVATIVLLLVGHGALSIAGKAVFLHNLSWAIGGSGAESLLPVMGWVEIGMAASLLILRGRAAVVLLITIATWKLATESLWMPGGAPLWEWIERGGSYVAPLALALLRIEPARVGSRASDRESDRESGANRSADLLLKP